ncbi:MAG: hypothetical protein WC386_02865 [Candidatus Paceibacterota bacterium]|jgi:hypothetical protein
MKNSISQEQEAQEIIKSFKEKKIKGIYSKEKDFNNGSEDNKYSIWVELKVADILFKNGNSVEILKGKGPDIKVNHSDQPFYIEVKRFDKEDFRNKKLKKELIYHLDRYYPEWKIKNPQIQIHYTITSESVVSEKRKLRIPVLEEKDKKKELFKEIIESLKKKERYNKKLFCSYRYFICYFDGQSIKKDRRILIYNDFHGDDDRWLSNKIKILINKSNKKFKQEDFNILYFYYPHIEREYINECDWDRVIYNIWEDKEIKKIYNAIIFSDLKTIYKKTSCEDCKKIENLFKIIKKPET